MFLILPAVKNTRAGIAASIMADVPVNIFVIRLIFC